MRTMLAAGALAVAGLLAAGCSGGTHAGTGRSQTPAAANNADAGGNAGPNAKSLWISCLQSHGAPIPSPGAGHNGGRVNRNSPQLRRAMRACRSLQPVGVGQIITAQDQVDYLEAARCMRTHGVPQFPDPVFVDGGVNFPVPAGLDTHTPQVLRAIATCRRLIPQGLPYSR